MGDKNKIKYGLKNVYYAKATFDEEGDVSYEKPVHIPGAVSLSLDSEGESEPWYADNTIYVTLSNNAGYSGDLEVALIPGSFYEDILHEERYEDNLLLENINSEVEHFALLFQFEGDKKAIRHVLYNCTCSRPAIESATTEDTKEPQTDTLSIMAYPLRSGYVKAKTGEDTDAKIYDGWFDAVYLPENSPEKKTYTVEFYDGNTLLETVTEVPYGSSVSYSGVEPSKIGYTFTGWSPNPTYVTSDMKCYAVYQIKTFIVEFWNGDELLQSVTVEYGGSTIYIGPTPTREGYVFTEWAPEPTNITEDTKCYAQFKVATFTVEFWNGDTLLESVVVEYGKDATYSGTEPEKEGYTFTGWDPDPSYVTSNMVCYAQFDEIEKAAFAIYSEDDDSLIFYADDEAPTPGSYYKGRMVSEVYTGVEHTAVSRDEIPWYANREKIKMVFFDDSFSAIKPGRTTSWFYDFSSCESIDVGGLNTSQVTNMKEMFYGCCSLKVLDLSGFDTSQVNDMAFMFDGCNELESLDISNFDTSKVTTMYSMFYGCKALKTLDLTGFDTSEVTSMYIMFQSCSSLEELDLSGFDTSKVTMMRMMFYSCGKLKTIYSNDLMFVTDKVSEATDMFASCQQLIGGAGTEYDATRVGIEMAHVDTKNNPGYFTEKN